LDDKIPKYKKFNENHPMAGITYDKTVNKYKIQYDNIKTNAKNLSTACEKIKEKIEDAIGNPIAENSNKIIILNESGISKKILSNNHYKLIKYVHNNKSYYDVQHILYQLQHKKSSIRKKYSSICNKISVCFWHRNKYNGFICRELITKKVIKLLIHKSQTPLAINLIELLDINIINDKLLREEDINSNKIMRIFNKNKCIPQKSFGLYRVDLYFPEYQLAIECDEHNHNDRNPQYEKQRQKYIEKMNVTFIRFDPNNSNFDILNVISQIHYFIYNYTNCK